MNYLYYIFELINYFHSFSQKLIKIMIIVLLTEINQTVMI